jgi:hypothetical protein
MAEKPVKRYTIDGKPMTPDDLRRLHDYLVDIEAIEIISDEMGIVVENEWPEFIHKLPPRRCSPRHLFRETDRRGADERGISSDARPAAAGSTAAISAKCSSTKGRCHIRRRISRNDAWGSWRMTMATCCFCERTEDQVTHLIQGPKFFICDICVDACVDTLATKDHGWRERQIDYLLRLRHRREQNAQPSANPN